VTIGNTATFTAAAFGVTQAPTVQWYVNINNGSGFTLINSATSPTLTVSNVTAGMNGYQYEATFTNDYGTATTRAATLSVVSATVTTLTDNGPNPSTAGQAVSFTATVTGGSAISGQTVSIEDADNANAVVASPTLTAGTVTFNISSLTVGTHHLFAVYNGDPTHAASNSSLNPVSQVVNAAGVAPAVASVVVNGGAPAYLDSNGLSVSLAGQNSVVEQILVTFDEAVTLSPGAFTITNNAAGVTYFGGELPSTLAVTANFAVVPGSGNTQYMVTFSGPGATAIPGGAGTYIKDGLYILNVISADVHSVVGSVPMAADVNTGFWALYGATDPALTSGPGSYIGDGNSEVFVDSPDFNEFKNTFGSETDIPGGPGQPFYDVAMDSNLDGILDATDFSKFKPTFGTDWIF
jgi:Bacterial Ig-like domain (group 3)